ncbi:PASTA domain-containing protein [Nannocystis exedens]|uniref:PASTA domain-containing protein n=1 Tax=Nannocystis exedens TaxID=54 RepID=A0A1I1W0M7_9BACT|nr:PASTA domain-containing protein [Nannocystis exedens]PCC72845.1 serine/threonine protein kinase [Nannocystis exedens]SFD86460.1 PASTA domain-containing protein [Nannocystis exedens]
MNDTVKMFLISLITAVLVQVLLGPQIQRMQQQQHQVPAPVALAPAPVPSAPTQPSPQAPAPPTAPAEAAIPAPEFVGTTIKDARKIAVSQSIIIIQDGDREAPDKTPGEILEQNPTAGTMLTSTREIRVIVARAREAKVPNLVGKPIAEAKSTLAGLGVEFTEVPKDSSKTPGTVLSQKPAAGVKVQPGTSVELTIAALPLIEVPAVTGKYLNKAKTVLKDSGLDVGDIKRVEHEEHGENYVLKQDPAAGAKVPFGTTITLTVVAPN